ncbi:hypothetical protein ACFE04_020207 [Oxalis oulophora]
MMTISAKPLHLVLAIACIAISATQALIEDQDFPLHPFVPIPQLPLPLPPWFPFPLSPKPSAPPSPPGGGPVIPGIPLLPDVTKCLSSVKSVEGCIIEIEKSFFSGKIDIIGPACCKAITKITDNCWPKLFPLSPLFPQLLKGFCAKASPPSATP